MRLGIFTIILTAFAISGCQKTYPYEMAEPCNAAKKLIVDILSGGSFYAEITPISEHSFKISNISYDYGKTYSDFELYFAKNPQLFSFLKELFAGNCTLHWIERDPQEPKGDTGALFKSYLIDPKGKKQNLQNNQWIILKNGKKYEPWFLEVELRKMLGA